MGSVKTEYHAFIDETGDHSLEIIDKDFPIFVLVVVVVPFEDYLNKIILPINELKLKYFKHEGVILHSRDIRKAQGDFGFLTDQEKKTKFIGDLNVLMTNLEYTVFSTVIKKENLKEKYGAYAQNPYDLSLKFCLERMSDFYDKHNIGEITFIAESRGKNEDNELKDTFYKICVLGTEFIPADLFHGTENRLIFVDKKRNVCGIQLSDLIGYPIGRKILNPEKQNIPFDIVSEKFYKGPGMIHGLKVFP